MYSSICSARKREIYDQVGEEGLKQGAGGAGSGAQSYSNIDPHELFSQFFGGDGGGSSPFGGLFDSAAGPGSTTKGDLQVNLEAKQT
jgi:DnaJ-class molecular chaperone